MKVHTDLFVSFVDNDTGALDEEHFFAASHETCLCVLCCIQYTVDGWPVKHFQRGPFARKGAARRQPRTQKSERQATVSCIGAEGARGMKEEGGRDGAKDDKLLQSRTEIDPLADILLYFCLSTHWYSFVFTTNASQ